MWIERETVDFEAALRISNLLFDVAFAIAFPFSCNPWYLEAGFRFSGAAFCLC